MKKAKSSKRKPAAKGKSKSGTVEGYFAAVPEDSRGALKQMRTAIRSVVPREATEVISYGIPAFRHNGVLVWYAAFASHCSLFPKASVIEAFEKELKGFTTSKGTIQFPIDKPLPIALIKKIVKARVAESQNEKRGK